MYMDELCGNTSCHEWHLQGVAFTWGVCRNIIFIWVSSQQCIVEN